VQTGVPVQVLIRSRAGDFVYTQPEIDEMTASIRQAKSLGVNGVVIGALTPEGHIDKEAIRRLMENTEGLSITFHRAFDVCKNPQEALEDIIALGCHRLLTSGQASSAAEGIHLIKQLVQQANGRLIIMPGAGVNPQNALHILNETGATEIHGSLRENGHTSADMVRAVTKAMEL
jgi:copper homeostasis protein